MNKKINEFKINKRAKIQEMTKSIEANIKVNCLIEHEKNCKKTQKIKFFKTPCIIHNDLSQKLILLSKGIIKSLNRGGLR